MPGLNFSKTILECHKSKLRFDACASFSSIAGTFDHIINFLSVISSHNFLCCLFSVCVAAAVV